MTKALYILGAGGHASSVLDAAVSAGWDVTGFIDPQKTGTHHNFPVLPNSEGLSLDEVVFALGIGTNFSRESVFESFRTNHPTAQFPPIIHSTAWVSPLAQLAEGSVVLSTASVGAGARIETGGLVNTGASLDHDCVLGPFSSLGPGARTGGTVTIGGRTMVGLGAAVLHAVTIGDDTVIGAQALVTQDLPDNVVAIGVPARTTKSRTREDSYY